MNNTRGKVAAIFTALILAVSACGSGETDRGELLEAPLLAEPGLDEEPAPASLADALAPCTPEELQLLANDPGDRAHPAGYIGSVVAIEVDGDVLAQFDPGESTIRFPGDPDSAFYRITTEDLSATTVEGDAPAQFSIYANRLGRLQEVAHDKVIFLSIAGDDPWAKQVAVVVDPASGEIGVEGGCFARSVAQVVSDFRAEDTQYGEMDAVSLVRDLIDRESPASLALIDFAFGTELTPWQDLSPDARFLDPDVMPDDVQALLVSIKLSFEVPDDWLRYAPGTLCSRIASLGWGDCIELTDGSPPCEHSYSQTWTSNSGLSTKLPTQATQGRCCRRSPPSPSGILPTEISGLNGTRTRT